MTLAEKLSNYTEEYWDFSEYRNETPLVRYPAVMVAPMQACILKEIISADSSIHEVLDPFCGSGTVLHEGEKLGLDVTGFDINPLATLITQVQLEGLPTGETPVSINALHSRLALLVGNVQPFSFRNIKKWFNDDVILSLSVIPLLWIDKKDLMLWDDHLLETFTAIDSSSLGGRIKRGQNIENMYSEYVEGTIYYEFIPNC